jgi:RNA polymerase sigma-70 factor (ECF subfamily)
MVIESSKVQPKSPANDLRAIVASLYEEHFAAVWRWLHRLGVRDADLDDVVHEVFMVVHRRYASFEGNAKITTWLFGICTRVASDYRRRAYMRRERATESFETLHDSGPRPDEAAQSQQAHEIVHRALDALDMTKRAVFVLYELEGLNAREISELTGAKEQTVYTRLHKAREVFRAEVERAIVDRNPKDPTP